MGADTSMYGCSSEPNRPYSHKLLTINNYVNCPSNFAFARSIHLPIFEKILRSIRALSVTEVQIYAPPTFTADSGMEVNAMHLNPNYGTRISRISQISNQMEILAIYTQVSNHQVSALL